MSGKLRKIDTWAYSGWDSEVFCGACSLSEMYSGKTGDKKSSDRARAKAGRWAAKHTLETGHTVTVTRELHVRFDPA